MVFQNVPMSIVIWVSIRDFIILFDAIYIITRNRGVLREGWVFALHWNCRKEKNDENLIICFAGKNACTCIRNP